MKSDLRFALFGLLLSCLPGMLSCTGSTKSPSNSPAALQILTQTVLNGTAGVSYTATLSATGGSPPYSWSIASGNLPPGLSLSATSGQISGTPGQAGSFNFVGQVTDSANQTAQRSLTITIGTSSPSQVTITIDPNATHQTWAAWGGTTFARFMEPTPACAPLPPAIIDGILNDLANDLGMNRIRYEHHRGSGLESAANDDDNPFNRVQSVFDNDLGKTVNIPCPNHTINDIINPIIVPLRNRVLARGEPFELHFSLVNYPEMNHMPLWWQNDPEEGAEMVEAVWVWFNTNFGFYPTALSWNEPDLSRYQSTSPPRWGSNFNIAVRRRIQALAGNSRPMEETTGVTPSETRIQWTELGAVAAAAAANHRLGFHGYDYNSTKWPSATEIAERNELRSRALAAGISTGMSEVCCKLGWKGGYDHGLDWVRDMYLNMMEADIVSWEPLALVFVCGDVSCSNTRDTGGDVIYVASDFSTHYRMPSYWVARQFSRYIRPGYVRANASCTGCTGTADRGPNFKAVAWKRPNVGTVVVNLINDSGGPITVTLSGLPSGGYDVHQLDPTMCANAGGKDRCTPQVVQVTTTSTLLLTIRTDGVWTVSQK